MVKEYNNDTSLLKTIESLTDQLNNKERELRLANERFKQLFEHSPIGMMITVNRVITFANNRMHELIDYKQPELIGKNTRILYISDEEYNKFGNKICNYKEFTEPILLKKKGGDVVNCVLKYTKCENENYVSVYIEAGE